MASAQAAMPAAVVLFGLLLAAGPVRAAVGEIPRVDMSVVEPGTARVSDPLAGSGVDGDYLLQLKTFSELEERAEKGEADAQWRLALQYYRGTGTTADAEAGFGWLTKAAEQDNPPAEAILGSAYQRGLGTATDYGKALYWFQKAADAGMPIALYQLGIHALRGWGVAANRENARTYFRLAHEKGLADGLCAQAQMDFEDDPTPEAGKRMAESVRQAVTEGSDLCMVSLAQLQLQGQFLERDDKGARALLLRAASMGNAHAQYLGAVMLLAGRGGERDTPGGLELARGAADAGVPEAQALLSAAYSMGEGVEKDPAKAAALAKSAAEQGSSYAQLLLFTYYREGIGVARDPAAARLWLDRCVAQGQNDCLYNAGVLYLQGDGATADPSKTLAYWTRAAEAGHPDSQYALGRLYLDGDVVPKDVAKARKLMEQAAAGGIDMARSALQYISALDSAGTPDPAATSSGSSSSLYQGPALAQPVTSSIDARNAKARSLLVKARKAASMEKSRLVDRAIAELSAASDMGSADADYVLARLYADADFERLDDAASFGAALKAAQKGSAEGQRLAGANYYLGKGVAQDMPQARRWFAAAADQGNLPALANLAYMMLTGDGGDRDPAGAYKAYLKAAEGGVPVAQYWIGRFLIQGTAVARDDTAARRWFQMALDQRWKSAGLWLGKCLYWGWGGPKDIAKARELFEAAGDGEALWYLARIYGQGEGVTADPAASLNYLRRSADLGYLRSMAGVGEAYYYGRGVPQDAALAKEWFLKAAEKGHAGSQFALGTLYARGEGVVADRARALEWFRQAARNGQIDAQIQLGGMLAGQADASAEAREEALFWLGVAMETLKPGPLRSRAESVARSLEQQLTPDQISEVRKRRADRGADPSATSSADDAGSDRN